MGKIGQSYKKRDPKKRVRCWHCDGTGQKNIQEEWYTNCKVCGGSGKIKWKNLRHTTKKNHYS
jgi:DnaJ-class molecular chaperone